MKNKKKTLLVVGLILIAIGAVLMVFAFMNNDSESAAANSESADFTLLTSTSEKEVEFPLNINTASVEELMEVPNLGEVKAQAIVSYREELGAYSSLEQITEIRGIGNETLNLVSPYLYVE